MTATAMKKIPRRLALVLLTASMAWTGVFARDATDCPTDARALPAQALHGPWQVTFDGADMASVVLYPHPDYEGGVRGTVTRAGLVAQLAGDIGDNGLLTLDESQDGRAISATWSGDLQAASCGKEFKGLWRNALDDSTRNFVLRKTTDRN